MRQQVDPNCFCLTHTHTQYIFTQKYVSFHCCCQSKWGSNLLPSWKYRIMFDLIDSSLLWCHWRRLVDKNTLLQTHTQTYWWGASNLLDDSVACWEMLFGVCVCTPESAEQMFKMLFASPAVSLTSTPPRPPLSPPLLSALSPSIFICFFLSLPLSHSLSLLTFFLSLSLTLTHWKRGTQCLSCHKCKCPHSPPPGLVMVCRTPMTDNDWANEFLN